MIHIEERITSKVPGITSVFVSFDYNKEIVDEMKQIPCYNFSKRTKEWEVPIIYLSQVIDRLTCFDDIALKCCNIEFPEFKQFDLGPYKTTPFDYQLEGINYGLNNPRWLLLDPPGLGKTLQLTYLAEELYKQGEVSHCLVICGINTLKLNWKKEILKHSNLSCKILGEYTTKKGKVNYGGIDKRLEQLDSPIEEFFVITNVETLRDDRIINSLLHNKHNKFDMMIVDEIHKCKGSTSQQGSNLLKLKAKYMIGATGTLLLNNPLDAYVPLNWIGADNSTKSNFENYYQMKSNGIVKEFIGYRNLDTLKKQLELFSLRRPKSLLNLPEKNIIYEYIEMEDSQKTFYKQIVDGVKDEVDKIVLKPSAVLSLILRLRQVTASPSILTSKPIPSAKLDRACDLCEEIISNGEKVVIFSTFKETIVELEKRLAQYHPLIGTGDIPDDIISNNNVKFQEDDTCKLFIGTWQKCGTGLTLTAATNLIFIDTPYTDGAFQQACDRIYRIGTQKPVFIYVLITEGTVDERVKEIVEDKEAISNYILDGEITEKSLSSLQKYIQEL